MALAFRQKYSKLFNAFHVRSDAAPGRTFARARDPIHLSSEYGTCKTVKTGLWPWPSGKSPSNFSMCSLFARKRLQEGLPPHSRTGWRGEIKVGGSVDHICEDRVLTLTSLTPNTVELIPTRGALSPRGGPVQDPVLTAFCAGGSVDCIPRT